ncbi:MAG: dihydroorotase [Chloroflexota bacterium]
MTAAAGAAAAASGLAFGEPIDLDLSRAWLVDPVSGREGPGEIVVRGGVLEALTWLDGTDADGVDDRGVIVVPGFTDLHAHFREPGNEDAETIATGLAAAAHGGFTRVCLMPDSSPPLDDPAVLARIAAAHAASGSPVALRAFGAITAGLAGEQLALLGELADAGVAGFSEDGASMRSASLLANALAYAGMLGLPVVDHADEPSLSHGAEAADGLVATVLGLRGQPAAAEASGVARDIQVLAEVIRDVPGARLHLAHLSTAESVDLVRRAKRSGLPVTCDVTPHHLALSDEWVAGSRRLAWDAIDADGVARDPWRDGAITGPPFDPSVRVDPPLRSPVDAAACLAGLLDGTIDAVATDHAPQREVDKAVEFGLAAGGIAGIETALGLLLAAVDAGRLPLRRALAALTMGPSAVLSAELPGRDDPRPAAGGAAAGGLVVGEPADLVVFDRSERWRVTPDSLRSKAKINPLLGWELAGRVLFTVAGGRLAFADPG